MYRIEPMRMLDIAEVNRVERRCFTNPWPSSAYRRELHKPEQNYYLVLRAVPSTAATHAVGGANGRGAESHADGPRRFSRFSLLSFARKPEPASAVVGFAGMWIMFDEAHVTTIGVDPPYRGRGLGELLLVALFDEALRRNAAWLTLEVRVSNEAAQALYLKYGFTTQGTRKRYYSDNNEDAYIMWSSSLRDADYLATICDLRARVAERFGLPPLTLERSSSVSDAPLDVARDVS